MKRWFLPESPDVIGLLLEQADATVAGIDAFMAWSHGDAARSAAVMDADRRAGDAARRLLAALTQAFTTPISAEDAYELSERLDAVLDAAKSTVREAEVLAMPPDRAMADMATQLAGGVAELAASLRHLTADRDRATRGADAAIERRQALEQVYLDAMSGLGRVDRIREVTERRELYRRYARMGDAVERVAHRVWYTVVKEA